LQDREARYSALVEHSSDPITIVEEDATVIYQSPSVVRLLGWNATDPGDWNLLDLLHPEDRDLWAAVVSRLTADPEDEVTMEWRLRHFDGTWRTFQSVLTNLLYEPSVAGLVLNSRDVTDQRELETQLRHQALHDRLTGLANRALFLEHLDRAVRRRARSGGSLEVMLIDLDDFTAVNDLCGHARGDELLQQVARRLQETLRDADAIARVGGDEFAVLFEGSSAGVDSYAAATRLLEKFAQPFELGADTVAVTASIGVATDITGAETDDELMRHADLAMYAAKAQGKRSCAVYTSDLHGSILDAMRVETELRRALERDEFVLFYHPIVHIETGRATGVEALIRWNHPERGLVNPGEFIPIAESSGLVVPIGEWTLRRACSDLQMFAGDPDGAPLRLSVNVSPLQLSQPGFVAVVRDILQNAQLDVARLTLEVTETLFVDDLAGRLKVLSDLRGLGMKIAIDDFGTGYSSLGSLRDMPVDILKIDKSFVDHIVNSPESARLVRMILQLADDFHLHTVAEGAEDLQQVQLLRALGCPSVQGYFFSRPLPACELTALRQHDFSIPSPRPSGELLVLPG